MGRAAVEAARSVGYVGAGTVEFLLDEARNFYFLEMNTRLQVEHPITEETLGLDLVRAQIEIAAGAQLPPEWRNGELSPPRARHRAASVRGRSGSSSCRGPAGSSSGRSRRVPVCASTPAWERARDVGLEFDPLLAKLVVSAPDRDGAIARARRAVSEWVVLGVETNGALLSAVLESPDFQSGRYATDLVGSLDRPAAGGAPPPDAAWIAAALAFELEEEGAGGLPADTAARRPRRGGDPWDAASGWRAGV